MGTGDVPDGLIVYGPDANCTLALCPASASVYEYRPSLAASTIFIVLFGLCMVIHIIQGIRWRTWVFMTLMSIGCICEMIGYGGRIILWQNPFSFIGFLLQIITITFAPVWYTAAIYITLYKTVLYVGVRHARFNPRFYYWVFIPCDVFSLVLQAVGGALSSQSSGGSGAAVDISIAGLSFQVASLCVFIALSLDYAYRAYSGRKSLSSEDRPLEMRFKVFVGFLSAAIILILIRCAYRIDELSDGYFGPLIHNQGLFIGLEGVMIIVAAFFLNIAHPGPVFGRDGPTNKEVPFSDVEGAGAVEK